MQVRKSERNVFAQYFFFFFTLVTGPSRSLSLKLLSDTRVYEPHIRAHLGNTARFCEVVL